MHITSDPAHVLLRSQHGCSNFDLEALGRLAHHHSSNAPKVWQVEAPQQVLLQDLEGRGPVGTSGDVPQK